MSEHAHFDVLIVGGGHAGAQAAIALRQGKFAGSIGLIGAERELPYERPPLSKDYLTGEKPFERLLLRAPAFWEERDVTMMLGHRVLAVDPAGHQVFTDEGEAVGYGQLIWATGGAPRRLTCDGHDLFGIHTVRDRADVDRIKEEIERVTKVVIIGAGYIGLEAAAALSKWGKRIVLLEALPRVLMRVAGAPLGRFFEEQHRAHGIDLRLETAVSALLGTEGRVTAVQLADGEEIPADMVIVGIGIEPAVGPLLAAGAEGGNGVAVDAQCRTSLPDIFAIGDCALHANRFADGRTIRLESVQNANDQAGVVAATILGREVAYDSVPWFWSNQYDLKLQTVGLLTDHDQLVVRGAPEDGSFSVIYLRGGKVIAVDAVNAIKDYVGGRKLVVEGVTVDPAALADVERPLASFA